MTALYEQCIDTWVTMLRPYSPDFQKYKLGFRDALLWSAEYLGRLLQANGCKTIDEIVRAAEEAAIERALRQGAYEGPFLLAPLVNERAAKFFAAILTEALAKGRDETFAQSWFERYGIVEFGFNGGGGGHERCCGCSRTFDIPPFTIKEERT